MNVSMNICPPVRNNVLTDRFKGLVILVGGLVGQWETVGDFEHPIEVEPKE